MKTLKLFELVEDASIYPRLHTDAGHVRTLVEALEAGAELPQMIVERETNRLVDGWHRKRAYTQVHGDDFVIEVDDRTYASEGDLFLEAARLNAEHGRRMTSVDFVQVYHRATQLGVSDITVIARSLSITVKKLEQSIAPRYAVSGVGDIVPLKRSLRGLRGQTLTPKQQSLNRKASGMPPGFHVRQLILFAENDMLDLGNQDLRESLQQLYELLEGLLEAV